MTAALILLLLVVAFGGTAVGFLVHLARDTLRRSGQVVDRLIERQPARYAAGVAAVPTEGGEQG